MTGPGPRDASPRSAAAPRRRPGLGRGLDALLPESLQERSGDGLLRIRVEEVRANPNQPRRSFDAAGLAELAASIKALGILQPLVVRSLEGSGAPGYELVAGERRLRAASEAGLSEVPVVVVETDDRGSLERALVENIHRADLNPLEEAAAYRQLIDEGGLTQEALASRIGRNRVTITNSLRLLDLPMPVQELISGGRLSAGHGKALLGLEGNPFLERMARRAAQEELSVRDTEDLVRRYQSMAGAPGARLGGGGEQPGAPRTGGHAAEVMEAQRRLAHRLQTRVRVEMGKRKGKIVVDFVSLEELDRLTQAIAGEDADGSRGVIRLE